MQENLGITLVKVALLAMILFVLTLNTCQMTSIEERYNEVQTELRDVKSSINNLESRVNKLSDSPVNVNLNFPTSSNVNADEVKNGTVNNTSENKSEIIEDKNDPESIENPTSLTSLKDYAYYNQDVLMDMVMVLQSNYPEKYNEFEYYGFGTPIEDYSELIEMLKSKINKILAEPNKADSYISEDNRDQLIEPNSNMDSKLTFAYFDDPKTFNPLVSSESQFSRLIARVNNSLCMRDPANPDDYIGLLAKRATITDDYKCYTFWLKPGVKWNKPVLHSNDPRYDWVRNADVEVTAEDFAFTLEMIYNPAVECNHIRSYFLDNGKRAARINIVNRYLFQIIWSLKTYQSKEFSLVMYPWPKHIYSRDEFGSPYDEASIGKMFNDHWFANDNNIVGCGPYILSRYRKAEEIQLIRNENYHSVLPPVKNISCKIVNDNNLEYRMFRDGDLDFIALQPYIWKRDVHDDKDPNSDFNNGKIRLEEYTSNSYNYIGWNNERVYFTDPKVRRAMTHAFNREGIVKNVYYNLATVVTGNFWNESPQYDKSIKPYEFNLQKASELLDEAGWTIKEGNTIRSKIVDGEEVFFSFVMVIIDGNDVYQTSAKIFSEDLKQIGVEMIPKPTKWAALLKILDSSDFDAVVLGWALSYEADPYQVWHSSEADKPNSSNHIKFRNKEADKIIDELRVTFDKDKRVELCHKFHRLIHELQPYTFFVSRKNVGVNWYWLKNLKFGAYYPRSYIFPVHSTEK